jgi:M61 glycyl aminopeptidase
MTWSRILTLSLMLLGSVARGEVVTFEDSGRRLEITISEEFSAQQTVQIQEWLESISTSLLSVYGHWPRQYWRVRVENTSGASSDPIPWAQVNRGGVDEVEFFVVNQVSAEQLRREWTGYHELAHLLIPYRGWGDAWFSEGLASYYQNLLQARSGVISEQEMWQRLHDGFIRGRQDSGFDGQPLNTVSAGLRQHGGFMRVYWSGAWYFLAADLALRSQSQGLFSLDTALAKLNACCAERPMSVPSMVQKLDQLNQVKIFSSLYRDAVKSESLPAFEPLFDALGIAVVNGQIQLEQSGTAAALRRGISATPPL